MKKTTDIFQVMAVLLCSSVALQASAVRGEPPAYPEDERLAAYTHVRINGLTIAEALRDGMIEEVQYVNHVADQMHIAEGEDLNVPHIFGGYGYSTKNLAQVTLKAAYNAHGVLEISTDGVLGNALVSGVRKDGRPLSYDELARNVNINNHFVPGMVYPVISSRKGIKAESDEPFNFTGLMDARGPIDIHMPVIEFDQQLVRTPTGLFMEPTEAMKEWSIFSSVTFRPNLDIYMDSECQLQQSWTSFVSGKIDFKTGEIDMLAHNASLYFQLNKDLPRD